MMSIPKLLFTSFLAIAAGVTSTVSAQADLTVIRPGNNVWYTTAGDNASGYSAVKWGVEGDVPVPADYDGDGILDIAVWRPSDGIWYINRSTDGSVAYFSWGKTTQHPTGGLPDVPVTGDYDGDSIGDIAVWRPDTGVWYVLFSSENFDPLKSGVFSWGRLGDIPVQADYDGDGRDDHAVFRSMENRWYIFRSQSQTWSVKAFGLAGQDMLVPADYSGDGKADIAVYRSGTWWIEDSTTGAIEALEFGFADGIPVPADYDNDGAVDLGVFREGQWYINKSTDGSLASFRFGLAGDVPLNSLAARPSIVGVP